jgi:uncharacterized protein (DUF2267 family)
MTGTGLDVFDHTVQETNVWLRELSERLYLKRHDAYVALRAVLHTLRDRIGRDNAVHLGAQLPTLIRGVYYEGWTADAVGTKERHKKEFLDHVRAELPPNTIIDADQAVRGVFDLLWDKIDPGEVAKLISLFPAELRDFWPRLARAD